MRVTPKTKTRRLQLKETPRYFPTPTRRPLLPLHREYNAASARDVAEG